MGQLLRNFLSVGGVPAHGGGGGHIFGALHPALDLCRGHPGRLQLLKAGNDGVILQAQVIAGAALHREGQAAGLGALAPVSAAGAKHGAEIALSRDRHAQSAVYEYLQLDGGGVMDFLDFLQGQLPGKHHSGKAGVIKRGGAGWCVNRHLGGGVQPDFRRRLPQ